MSVIIGLAVFCLSVSLLFFKKGGLDSRGG